MIKCSNKDVLWKYTHKDRAWIVYKIYFGDKFYIGMTNQLVRRAQAHQSFINRGLRGRLHPTYAGIVSYIQRANIKTFKVQVFCECLNSDIAQQIERALLLKYFGTHNCLNVTPISIKGAKFATNVQT